MNVEIGTVAQRFLFWEYLFQIFGIVSMQCATKDHSDLSISTFTIIYPFFYLG
jgi:hypothetical protein